MVSTVAYPIFIDNGKIKILLAESELGLKDPAIENFNESGSAELYLTVTPILVILFMTTPSFALL